MSKYELIFEGPQSGDTDTLRKLKGAFIGELNFSIDETVNALSNFPLTIRESENNDALQDVLVALLAAGAKAHIKEPDPGSEGTAPAKAKPVAAGRSSDTLVLELAGDELPASPPNATLGAPEKSNADVASNVPVLSSAQSTLLSLEDDFVPQDPAPNPPRASAKPATPEPTQQLFSLDETPAAEQPASPPAPSAAKAPVAPAVTPTPASALESFTLELAAVDPEPHSAPADEASLLNEPELETHFEPENEGAESTPQTLAPKREPEPTAAPVTQPAASIAETAATPATIEAAPASPAVQAPPSLIPAFVPPAAPAAAAVENIAVNSAAIAAPRKSQTLKKRQFPSWFRDIAISVLAPLAVLTIGNVVYFSFIAEPTPAATASASRSALKVDDLEPAVTEKKAAVIPPGVQSGEITVGDFKVAWRVNTINEDVVGVALKITPPAPGELTPQQIVAGIKPPLKVTTIELEDIPLTKVGRFAVSGSGPARVALTDDGKALRAVAEAQFALEYNPEKKSISGEISLQTEAAGDSPLRWIAERGERSRPVIKLRLSL